MMPVGMETKQPLWKTRWHFPGKLSMHLAWDQRCPHPLPVKASSHRKTHSRIFSAPLFIVAPNRKPPDVHQQVSGYTTSNVSVAEMLPGSGQG